MVTRRTRLTKLQKTQVHNNKVLTTVSSGKMGFKELVTTFKGDIDLAFNFHLISRGLRVGIIIDRNATYFTPGVIETAIEIATKSDMATVLQYVLSKDGSSLLVYNTTAPNVFSDDVLKQAFQLPAGVICNQLATEFCIKEKKEDEGDGSIFSWIMPPKQASCLDFAVNGVLFYQEKCSNDINIRAINKWIKEGKALGLTVGVKPCVEISDAKFTWIMAKLSAPQVFVHKFDIARKFWGESFWQISGWLFSHRCTSVTETRNTCRTYGTVLRFIASIIKNNYYVVSPESTVSQVRKCRDLIGELETELYNVSSFDRNEMNRIWTTRHFTLVSAFEKEGRDGI